MATSPFDPQQLPIDSVAGEAAVAPARLLAAALRQRFAAPPPWQPEAADESGQSQEADGAGASKASDLSGRAGGAGASKEPDPSTPSGASTESGASTAADASGPSGRSSGREPIRAAVLVPLVLRDDGVTVLLTRRTDHLSSHPGQISFPGGRAEPDDACAVDTALRETEEEVGLPRRHVEVLGTLPDYVTGSGYRVTPVVGLVAPPFPLRADPSEVADIFEVPLAFLMDGAHHQRLSILRGGRRHRFYAMPYQRCYIWGATAGMLRNLFHFLRA